LYEEGANPLFEIEKSKIAAMFTDADIINEEIDFEEHLDITKEYKIESMISDSTGGRFQDSCRIILSRFFLI